MLTTEAQKYIAAVDFYANGRNYVVIADNTTSDVSVKNLVESDYTIVHSSNDYDAAVESANFWDERMNTHFVKNDVFKLSIVKDLADNDLELPMDHKHYNEYKSLSVADTIVVMSNAAIQRVNS